MARRARLDLGLRIVDTHVSCVFARLVYTRRPTDTARVKAVLAYLSTIR